MDGLAKLGLVPIAFRSFFADSPIDIEWVTDVVHFWGENDAAGPCERLNFQ